MKRFHLHLSVEDLSKNISFYTHLFGTPPTVQKEDYAKWMLDDPRINFAISTRAARTGIDHIGIQVESATELEQLKAQYMAADQMAVVQQQDAACCYAQSNKYWLADPQGIAWEAFHTLADIPTFHQATNMGDEPSSNAACCVPRAPSPAIAAIRGRPLSIPIKSDDCC